MAARKNDEITAAMVRVIGPDGEQRGILPISAAIKMARELGLDLVEIAPRATPPVARIMDALKSQHPFAAN